MQFKVPQFLDIEDKIFGPFTFRQFVYLAGAAGLDFILYKLLGILLGGIPILAISGLALLLAFYRPNNKPFIEMMEAWVKYFTQSKLYIWKKNKEGSAKSVSNMAGMIENKNAEIINARLSGSKLRDLAWSLDVLDLSKNQEQQL